MKPVNYFTHVAGENNHFIGKLDLEVFIGGLGSDITAWPEHWDFSEDFFWRLYLPVSGEFELQFTEETVSIRPGGLYLIPAMRPFQYRGISPCTHYWIHFISDQLCRVESLRTPLRVDVDTAQYEPEIRELIESFRQCKTIADTVRIKNRVMAMLGMFLDRFLGIGKELKTDGNPFSEVSEYIDLRLDKNLEISELSSLIGMSRARFSAEFRKRFGLPPKQYISMHRLGRAKILLVRTQMPIKEIALKCGYENEFFFYRIFRKYVGFTPNEYRQYNKI